MPSLNTKLATAPNVSANYVLKATTSTTIGNSLIFDDGTNVGIGTTTLGGRLDVRAGGTSAFTYYFRNAAGNYGGGIYNTGSNNTQLYLATSAGTENVVLSASGASYLNGGNVGIGTSSPFNKLTVGEVAATSYGLLTYATNWASDTWTGIKIGAAADSGLAGVDIRSYSYYASSSATSMAFFTNSSSNTLTERVRITTTGQLNLGTYHEQSKFCPGADSNHYLRYLTSLDGLELSGYSGLMFSTLGGTERMRITNVGEILYNTSTTPYNSALFRANYGSNNYFSFGPRNNDNAFVVWNNGGTGVYLQNGNTSWTGISDERLKDIKYDIENAFDIIKDWRSVVFSWKDEDENNLNVGLIAQDVQKTLPQIIDTNKLKEDNVEYLGVRYSEVIPVLVKAIQELKAEVDSLKQLVK